MRGKPLIALLALNVALGCSPAQRRAAGLGVAGLGLATTTVGVSLIDPCLLSQTKTNDTYPYSRLSDSCHDKAPQESRGAAPEAGAKLSFVGLGVMVLGGILFGTGAIGSKNQSQHGAGATPLQTREVWPTPHHSDDDF